MVNADGRIERGMDKVWWQQAVALNHVPGWTGERKFGYRLDVDTTFGMIWPGTDAYNFPTAAQKLNIVSASTLDAAGTAGAQSVLVIGLGSDWKTTQELVVMNGTTTVTGTTDFVRINRVLVGAVGTYAYNSANASLITVSGSADGNPLAYVPAGDGVTQQSVYSVAADKEAYLWSINFSEDANKAANFRGRVRQNADVTTGSISPPLAIGNLFGISTPERVILDTHPAKLPPKTDFWLEASVGNGTGTVTGAFSMMIVNAPTT